MLDAAEAYSIILSHRLPQSVETIPLSGTLGRVLASDIVADMDQPPFHRVAMDGVAINQSTLKEQARFKILGTISAGSAQSTLPAGDCCFEIMTGAVLPEGADMVIRYEDLVIKDGFAQLASDIKTLSSNFHDQGSDYRRGDVVLKAGTRIKAPHTAILASVGCAEVKVIQLPKIAILSTGDELVDIHETPRPHQIRWSNGISLRQELAAFGFTQVSLHKVKDDEDLIRQTMQELLRSSDVLLLTGGVSAGKFDFVPRVLKDCSVREIFHKVAQRPGKPLWFGATADNKVVFGLPGNPVSCLVNLRKYVIPFLSIEDQSLRLTKSAFLGADVKFDKKFTYYCPVKVINEGGKLMAYPLRGNGSGDFFQLKDSDGFMELRPENAPFTTGLLAEVFLWGEGK